MSEMLKLQMDQTGETVLIYNKGQTVEFTAQKMELVEQLKKATGLTPMGKVYCDGSITKDGELTLNIDTLTDTADF